MPELMTGALAEAKRALRREFRARRRRQHATQPDGAHALARRVLLEVSVPPGSVAAGYWPDDGEIDPRPLMAALAERGVGLALPAVVERAAAPVYRAWKPGEPLRPDRVGIPAPVATAPSVVPDLVLCPLVAFDAGGRRLGRGGGYIDRALAALGPGVRVVGLAWEQQRADRIPTAAHDRTLDMVVTECRVYRRDHAAGVAGP